MTHPDHDARPGLSVKGVIENIRHRHVEKEASELFQESFAMYTTIFSRPDTVTESLTAESPDARKLAHVAHSLITISNNEDIKYQLLFQREPHAFLQDPPRPFETAKDGFRSFNYNGDAHFPLPFGNLKKRSPEVVTIALIKLLHKLDPAMFPDETMGEVRYVRSQDIGINYHTQSYYDISLNPGTSLRVSIEYGKSEIIFNPFRTQKPSFLTAVFHDPDKRLAKRYKETEQTILRKAANDYLYGLITGSSEEKPVVLVGGDENTVTMYDVWATDPVGAGATALRGFEPDQVRHMIRELTPEFTVLRDYAWDHRDQFTSFLQKVDSVGGARFTFRISPVINSKGENSMLFMFWLTSGQTGKSGSSGRSSGRPDMLADLQEGVRKTPPDPPKKDAPRID